jgi:hypothetical protein
MIFTESTPLMEAAGAAVATKTASTTTTSINGKTPANTTSNPSTQHDHKIRHIYIGFSLGIGLACLLLGVFTLGFIVSSHVQQQQQQSSQHNEAVSSSKSIDSDNIVDTNTQTNDDDGGRSSGIDSTMTVTRSKDVPASVTYDESTTNAASPPPSQQQYVATQFISFTINTMGGLQEYGECEDDDNNDKNDNTARTVDRNGLCYLGDRHNITHDVEHRLQIVKYVLKRIKQDSFAETPDIDHMDNVLKIVSLPEFFWRGPYGAYTIDEINHLFLPFAQQLRHMILDDFYSDFLFCFGTIIATRSREKIEQQQHATDMEYYNFAPISLGGRNHHSYIVTKQYISNADFLSRTSARVPNPTEEDVRDYSEFDTELQRLFEQENNSTLVQDNVIVVDSIRIGIEICLDHRLGVLWNNLLSKHHGKGLVDVLLITSAGMAIERGPNPIVPGGVVYLCDGSASSAVCMRPNHELGVAFHPNHVCRGDTNILGLKHIPVGSPG